MSILAAYALPHPPLAIPEIGQGKEKEIQDTLDAFMKVSQEVKNLEPDTIIFITPHTVAYSDYFHISPGLDAGGDFANFGAPTVTLTKPYDVALAAAVTRRAEELDIRAGTMGERDPALDHGVMIPMWFLDKNYSEYKCLRVSQSGFPVETHYIFGRAIAQAVNDLNRKAVIIASGDLSHKLLKSGPYGYVPEGPEYDRQVTQALSQGDFLSLMNMNDKFIETAADCGYRSYIIMAGCLDKTDLRSALLSYEGPFGVGYAVLGFYPEGTNDSRDFERIYLEQITRSSKESKQTEDEYQSLARKSLEHLVKTGIRYTITAEDTEELPAGLTESQAGVFVSLHINGRLRGCIGTITPTQSNIAREIIQNAEWAGLSDDRFAPVTVEELPLLTYKVDVLKEAEQISDSSMLDVNRYGVIVSNGSRWGLLLPNLEGITTVNQQLSIARSKASIGENESIQLYRFEVVRHG
ncbi:MAG: AmmeMemoRadiSam system protein A [Clostridiales bacterium]|jgi:AmmeMemoRadiSam system protein A|nr:AmmeMemoRadiSam system protein A [Clostridiales bacterium]